MLSIPPRKTRAFTGPSIIAVNRFRDLLRKESVRGLGAQSFYFNTPRLAFSTDFALLSWSISESFSVGLPIGFSKQFPLPWVTIVHIARLFL